MEHKGGLQFTSVFGEGGPFQKITGINGEKVHHIRNGRGGHGHEESVHMRLMLAGGQQEELPDAMVLPFGQKLIQSPMKGLSLDSRRPGIPFLAGVPDPVLERGRQKDLASPGNFLGNPLHNEGVGAKGEMGPMLGEGSYRKEEAGIESENPPDVRPGEVPEGP